MRGEAPLGFSQVYECNAHRTRSSIVSNHNPILLHLDLMSIPALPPQHRAAPPSPPRLLLSSARLKDPDRVHDWSKTASDSDRVPLVPHSSPDPQKAQLSKNFSDARDTVRSARKSSFISIRLSTLSLQVVAAKLALRTHSHHQRQAMFRHTASTELGTPCGSKNLWSILRSYKTDHASSTHPRLYPPRCIITRPLLLGSGQQAPSPPSPVPGTIIDLLWGTTAFVTLYPPSMNLMRTPY